MKKFIVTLTALCAISTGSIAAETSSSIKSVSEVSKVTTQVFVPKASSTTQVFVPKASSTTQVFVPKASSTTQVFVPKASSTTGVQGCTMWPQNPWDVRCPW